MLLTHKVISYSINVTAWFKAHSSPAMFPSSIVFINLLAKHLLQFICVVIPARLADDNKSHHIADDD